MTFSQHPNGFIFNWMDWYLNEESRKWSNCPRLLNHWKILCCNVDVRNPYPVLFTLNLVDSLVFFLSNSANTDVKSFLFLQRFFINSSDISHNFCKIVSNSWLWHIKQLKSSLNKRIFFTGITKTTNSMPNIRDRFHKVSSCECHY